MDWTERRERAHFAVFRNIQLRWMDNDIYGHVNNAHYYSFFDSAVNGWLAEQGLIRVGDPARGMYLVAESACRYLQSLAFPDDLEVGLTVGHLGSSSVHYHLGVFRRDAAVAAAIGRFVHIHVDSVDLRPCPIPTAARALLAQPAPASIATIGR